MKFKQVIIAGLILLSLSLVVLNHYSYSLFWLLIPIHFILFFIGWGSAQIKSNMFVDSIHSFSTSNKEIIISFDDGPIQGKTEKILDILKEKSVPAIFFCVGNSIEKNKSLFKRIVVEHHEVGNHTFSHSPWLGLFGKKRFNIELEDTDVAIQSITKKQPQLYRPPYGVTNPIMASVLKKKHYKVIGWSIRSFDTQIKNTEKLLNRIISQLSPGGILLLHDAGLLTVDFLAEIIDEVRKEGYEFVSAQKLLKEK